MGLVIVDGTSNLTGRPGESADWGAGASFQDFAPSTRDSCALGFCPGLAVLYDGILEARPSSPPCSSLCVVQSSSVQFSPVQSSPCQPRASRYSACCEQKSCRNFCPHASRPWSILAHQRLPTKRLRTVLPGVRIGPGRVKDGVHCSDDWSQEPSVILLHNYTRRQPHLLAHPMVSSPSQTCILQLSELQQQTPHTPPWLVLVQDSARLRGQVSVSGRTV